MTNPTGEARTGLLRLDFDRRVMIHFRGSVVTSDAGLLAYRELDDALGLSELAGEYLADERTGKNGRHALVGLLRQSVCYHPLFVFNQFSGDRFTVSRDVADRQSRKMFGDGEGVAAVAARPSGAG